MKILLRALRVACYSAVAASSLVLFIQHLGMNAYWRARFGDCVYGWAWRPYVTRVLVPVTVKVVAGALPRGVQNLLSVVFSKCWPEGRENSPVLEYPVESGVAAIILFACLLGFDFTMRALAAGVLKVPSPLPDVVAISSVLFLPGMYMYWSPLYDFATLLLVTAGLLSIWRGPVVELLRRIRASDAEQGDRDSTHGCVVLLDPTSRPAVRPKQDYQAGAAAWGLAGYQGWHRLLLSAQPRSATGMASGTQHCSPYRSIVVPFRPSARFIPRGSMSCIWRSLVGSLRGSPSASTCADRVVATLAASSSGFLLRLC